MGAIKKDDSLRMEEEARRMEARLASLRDMVERDKGGNQGGETRWKSAGGTKPLTRGYAQQVLKRRPSPRTPAAPGVAAKPEAVVEKLEEMGDFVKLPDFLPVPSAGASSASEKNVSAKLGARLAQQSDSQREVADFLEGLGLSRYVSLFMDHGFDEMETVFEIEEGHMDKMGIAMGHKLKIAKKLRELRPPPPPVQPRGGPGRRVQLAAEAETVQEPAPALPSGSLLDGEYDEAEQAASFAAAVAAWRTGGEEPRAQPPEQTSPPKASNPSSFWASMGGSQYGAADAPAAVRPGTAESGVAASVGSPDKPRGVCYRCFRQFYKDGDAQFCSEECSDAHEQEQATQASRRADLQSTQQRLQETIELVDRAQEEAAAAGAAEAADPAEEDLAPFAFAPQPVDRELLPA